MEPIFLPTGMTKYLQPLDVQFLQDYNYYFDIELTTREPAIQIHHLAYNQFSSPIFDETRHCAFQKALIKYTDPVYQ